MRYLALLRGINVGGKNILPMAKPCSILNDAGFADVRTKLGMIFDRFRRGSNAVTVKSDGVGLSPYIVKNIIEAHDDTIGVNSIEGKGSAFWFEPPWKYKLRWRNLRS